MVSKAMYEAIRGEVDRVRQELDSAYPRLTFISAISTLQLSIVAYTFKPEALKHFGSRFDVSITTLAAFGCIVGFLLTLVMLIGVMKPRSGKHWANTSGWLAWEEAKRKELSDADETKMESIVIDHLCKTFADIADENRKRVEQRFLWLDRAIKSLSISMVCFVVYVLAAGVQHVMLPVASPDRIVP